MMTLPFEKPFRVDRCHAAGTGRGYSLAIFRVLHIPGGEHSGNTGRCSCMGRDVAFLIHVELAGKQSRVRSMADCDKHAGAC